MRYPLLLGAVCALASPAVGQTPPAGQTPAAPAAVPTATPVKITGYVQVRETYRDGVGLIGSVNRARLSVGGGGTKDVTWRVQGEFRTGSVGTGRASVSLQDAYVRYKPENLGLQAGQFKTPFSREFITSLADVETADRATAVDSLAPKRDIGLMADYAFGTVGTLAVGVFNGEGQNLTSNADSTVLWVGRATARPISYLTLGANIAGYGGDSTRYGVDASLEYQGAALKGEYIGQHRDAGSLDDKGWYAQATYRVVPWVQLVVKQEAFRRSAINPAVRNQATTGGVNVDFGGGKVRLVADYVSRKIGTPGNRFGALITQAQVKF